MTASILALSRNGPGCLDCLNMAKRLQQLLTTRRRCGGWGRLALANRPFPVLAEPDFNPARALFVCFRFPTDVCRGIGAGGSKQAIGRREHHPDDNANTENDDQRR